MPRAATLVFALAALVAASAFAFRALAPGSSAPPLEEGSDAATLATVRELGLRLDRLEHEVFQPSLAPSDPAARLTGLEARLHALEQRPAGTQTAARTGASSDPAAGSPGGAPPAADVHSLSNEDLLSRARSLASKQARAAAAPSWRELLERSPSDELFVEAHLELAYAYRGAQDHEREEQALREALRVAGDDTERGQQVLFQLAWTANYRGDYATARDLMVSVANAPATSRTLTGHARLNVAHFSLRLNDGERAREALQSMLRDFGDSEVPIEAWFARQATERLAQLK